jgi:diaminopimelate decarboxylase
MNAQAGLTMEEVPLARIAAEVGTPAWVYSAAALRRRYHALRGALDDARTGAEIHFAVKANPNLAVLRTLAAEGAGADIVSEGELRLALAAGIAPGHIVYSGVGKSLPELRFALSQGVGQINAESAEEVEMISAIATALGVTAQVALRVNPDVDAKTHAKITTGKSENKFGVAIADAPALYARMAATPGIRPVGVAVGGMGAIDRLSANDGVAARIVVAVKITVTIVDAVVDDPDMHAGPGVVVPNGGFAPEKPQIAFACDGVTKVVLLAKKVIGRKVVIQHFHRICGNDRGDRSTVERQGSEATQGGDVSPGDR